MGVLAVTGGKPVRQREFLRWPHFDETEIRAVEEVVRSGKWWRYEGTEVASFEKEFAAYHQAQFAIAVTNGTAALELPLAARGIGPGDEVIVPSYTFVASATAIAVLGATPVFADVEVDTGNIDPGKLESLVSPRTRGIIPVHFAGYPAEMDQILAFARKHDLFVLEDAAHGHGGAYRGTRMLGSIGNAGSFSFQASKNITAGEGGAVICSDPVLAEKIFSRHTFGRLPGRPWYEHHIMSTNTRMTEMQGAILRVQLRRLKAQTEERYANGRKLDRAVAGIPGMRAMRHDEATASRRSFHLHMSRYAPGVEGVSRETFIKAMNAEGIPVAAGYPYPLYKQPMFQGTARPVRQECATEDLNQEGAEALCREVLWLPQNVLLEDGVEDVIRAFCKVAEHPDELRSLGRA